ncbi:MAG: hypothetical protein WDZ73_01395, partial [Candidatus Paceibacterota bacterium]
PWCLRLIPRGSAAGIGRGAWFIDDNKHYVTLWVTCKWSKGVASITEPDKFIDLGWYDFDSLPDPLFLPWRGLLASPDLKRIKEDLQAS